jgi:hypothetical protein
MRWNNYDLNIYCLDGTVTLYAYPLEWSKQFDAIGMPLYYVPDYNETSKISLFMNRSEHREAIAYVLDSEEWHENKDYWQEYDAWDCVTSYHNPPEPIKSWLKSLPAYHVQLTPELETQLLSFGLIDANGEAIQSWDN